MPGQVHYNWLSSATMLFKHSGNAFLLGSRGYKDFVAKHLPVFELRVEHYKSQDEKSSAAFIFISRVSAFSTRTSFQKYILFARQVPAHILAQTNITPFLLGRFQQIHTRELVQPGF